MNKDDYEPFLANLTALEDWLYDEGYDETKEVYQQKMHEIYYIYGNAMN